MARRFKFKPPPGVIVGTLLIWSPAWWLVREVRALRTEAALAAGATCEGPDCPREVAAVVESYDPPPYRGALGRAELRAGKERFTLDSPVAWSAPSPLFGGEGVTLRLWHGRALAVVGCKGGPVLAADHPKLRARDLELVLLVLGAVGMGILIVGALVGGLNEP